MSRPARLIDVQSGGPGRVPTPDDYVEFSEDETEQSVVDRFERQVALHADQPAVQTDQVDLTYAELNRAANRVAHTILANHPAAPALTPATGAGSLEEASEPVPVMIGQGVPAIAAAFGVWKAGKAYVPIEPADSKLRNSHILQDLSARVVVTTPECHALASELAPAGCEVICLPANDAAVSDANPGLFISPDALAYVIYTTGSTGDPKGVMHTHRTLLCDTWSKSKLYRISKHDRCSLLSSGTGQAIKNMTLALLNGASLHPKNVREEGPGDLIDWLVRRQISVLIAAAPLFRSLLDMLTGSEQFSHLRLIRLASDRVYPTDVERFQRHFAAPCVLLNGLSSTETGGICAYVIDKSTRIDGLAVPIGYPLDGVEVLLLDEGSDSVSRTASGVMAVKSRHLSRGYWRRRELTRQAFREERGDADARVYRSGDLGRRRPDGALEHVGRCDFQVKIRGYLVDTTEVEAALLAHEKVRSAVAHAWEDGRGNKRLIAYIVPSIHPAATVGELRKHLADRLAIHMIPAQFVTLDALPLLAGGKVNRRALPKPPRSRPLLANGRVLPGSAVEETLAGIWSELLDLDEVGIHDHFLELGGDSLLAGRVIARVIDAFGVELPIRSLFESPSIGQMAAIIEHDKAAVTTGSRLPPIPRRLDLESCPLSFAQERLWFLSQLDPDNRAYNMPKAIRLHGILDVEALRQAFECLVTRHAVLRTTCHAADGNPVQTIAAVRPFELPVIDLTDIPATQREAEARRVMRSQTRRRFDLSRDLMLRAALLRLGAHDHMLLIVTHHIASDDWSRGILYREIAALYEAFLAHRPSPLPELPLQYADYAIWQRSWLQCDVLQQRLVYWRDRLAGAPAIFEFPADHPRPARQSSRGARLEIAVDQRLVQALTAIGRREGATLFMVLLGAWQLLLSRCSGQTDIVVGSPIGGRNRTELEGLIGFFVNTLALRTDLSGNPTFRELLGRVREVTLGAYANQDLPFERLVEELQPQRNLRHTPLFQVMLVLQNAPRTTPELAGLNVQRMEIDSGTAKFDLTLLLQETADGLRGSLEYNTDLFEAATIRRLEGHLQVLLAGIVADPGRRICELPLLTETERRQVLVEWNQTGSRFPDDECIHELFEAQVARTPEAVAVVCGNEQLTYRELNTRANQFAHYLRHRGVRPETLVGICIDRSSAMMIGLLGILKAGGAYLPLDPAYPRERLAFLLDDSRASLVLTQLQWLDLLPADRARIVVLDEVHSAVAQEPAENPSCDATGENLAYVIYTSGSTGLPKGVQVPHRAVVNFLHSMSVEPGLGEQEVLLAVTTLSFDISVLELFLPLTVGARVVIVSREVATDGASLGAEVEAAQVTVMQATPATWQLLKESGWQGSRHLKILCGGEALTSDLADHLLEMGASVWNLYGPTETTVFSTAYHVKSRRTPVSIGGPIANTEVYVLNAARQTVPIGVPGELYIGGAGLARGYLNRPELTAEKFVADPFSNRPGARLYRTGDQVRWRADGNLEFLGRLDHQVKLRGFRIEPVEIETALTGQPHVTQSVVLVREDRPGDQRLVAYVVLRESATEQTVSGLRQSLREKLPEYMVPSAFVILDALPLTPNGKVDRKALPVPEVNHLEPAQACVAPRTCVEEQLATIWREVLGVDRIGIRDNFFERGGHSLLATRLASHIRRQFGLEIPLIAIFEAPTIERLSLVLLQGQAKVMRSEGMNELLGELESISEENAERQLRGARIQ